MSQSHEESAGAASRTPAPEVTLSRDAWGRWRNAFARLAALLLHAGLLALLLGGPAAEKAPAEPAMIPVELVMEPPVKKAEIAPKPQPPPPKPVQRAQTEAEPVHLELGGSPEMAPGRPPEVKPPKPAEPAEVQNPGPPVPPSVEPPLPAKPPPQALPRPKAPAPVKAAAAAPSALPQTGIQGEVPTPPQPAPAAATPAPQVASLPPAATGKTPGSAAAATGELQAPDWSESERRGAGGGDSYLNALRDAIIANIIYPGAAKGMKGVAKYGIEMNRNGFMLRVELVRSSGYPALDRAGMDAIQNTMPFQPVPMRIQGNHVFILATLYIGPQG